MVGPGITAWKMEPVTSNSVAWQSTRLSLLRASVALPALEAGEIGLGEIHPVSACAFLRYHSRQAKILSNTAVRSGQAHCLTLLPASRTPVGRVRLANVGQHVHARLAAACRVTQGKVIRN